VQPPLVVALELVVEDDPLDACAALEQARRGVFVGTVELEIVFQLSLAHEAGVEGLMAPVVVVPMLLEQLTSRLGQDDSVVAVARHPHSLDEPLFAQLSQVAAARVRRAIVVAAKVAAGDYSEGASANDRLSPLTEYCRAGKVMLRPRPLRRSQMRRVAEGNRTPPPSQNRT
jgi:hypothetical protein